MEKTASSKLHLQFARAKEAEGRYADAAKAYENAGELDSVARLCLQRLNNPQKALALVRQSRSIEGAAMLAKYCQEQGNSGLAVEFLLMAGKKEEAIATAEAKEQMEAYVRAIGDSGTNEEYHKLSNYFESRGNFARAGDMAVLAGRTTNVRSLKAFHYFREKTNKAVRTLISVCCMQALKFYMRAGENRIDDAIELVGKAQDDILKSQLLDYLTGENDGIVKDYRYLFKLHMALSNHEQAARTAVVVAKQEMEEGNYRSAHAHLYQVQRELILRKKHTPQDLISQLVLLHSYTLVKMYVKHGEHQRAARLLKRVGANISSFPTHTVPILTSCVIECQRAGLKQSAHEFATILTRPEYRDAIDEKYKRKIEQVVRRPPKEEEPQEELFPCPHCNTLGLEMQLHCDNCSNRIPFCIASGRRISLDEWAECPGECGFPCRYSDFVHLVQRERACPMCHSAISIEHVSKVQSPQLF